MVRRRHAEEPKGPSVLCANGSKLILSPIEEYWSSCAPRMLLRRRQACKWLGAHVWTIVSSQVMARPASRRAPSFRRVAPRHSASDRRLKNQGDTGFRQGSFEAGEGVDLCVSAVATCTAAAGACVIAEWVERVPTHADAQTQTQTAATAPRRRATETLRTSSGRRVPVVSREFGRPRE